MRNPELAGIIDGAMLAHDITEYEAQQAHVYRQEGNPFCFGHYDSLVIDCQRQDIKACQICKKLKREATK